MMRMLENPSFMPDFPKKEIQVVTLKRSFLKVHRIWETKGPITYKRYYYEKSMSIPCRGGERGEMDRIIREIITFDTQLPSPDVELLGEIG